MSVTISGYRFPRVLLAAAGTVIGLCAFASASQAACSYPDAEQVFAKWGDSGYYQLALDGGVEEGGNGWTVTGGAGLVAGNESEFLNGESDDTALSISYGGVATSPKVCVDASTPAFRLMALNSGDDHAKLRVTVSYESGSGNMSRTTDVRADGEWEPTDPLRLDAKGAQERVARISFTPKDDEGEWLLDDLYIDPFARR
jgi:hypothetical protein